MLESGMKDKVLLVCVFVWSVLVFIPSVDRKIQMRSTMVKLFPVCNFDWHMCWESNFLIIPHSYPQSTSSFKSIHCFKSIVNTQHSQKLTLQFKFKPFTFNSPLCPQEKAAGCWLRITTSLLLPFAYDSTSHEDLNWPVVVVAVVLDR
jgi:hypothetical protein